MENKKDYTEELKKLDLLYDYATGKIKDLNAKTINYNRCYHYDNKVFAIYNNKKLVDIIKEDDLNHLKAKLEMQYPNSSITQYKVYNTLKQTKMRFGKHINKSLYDIKDDTNYIKFCLDKIGANLTEDYKFLFNLMLNYSYAFDNKYIYMTGDEIDTNGLIALGEGYYVSEQFGNVFIKYSNMNKVVVYSGDIVEKLGVDFYKFV